MGIRRGTYSPSAISCMKEIFRRGYIHGQNAERTDRATEES
jgi:hypothetical protein